MIGIIRTVMIAGFIHFSSSILFAQSYRDIYTGGQKILHSSNIITENKEPILRKSVDSLGTRLANIQPAIKYNKYTDKIYLCDGATPFIYIVDSDFCAVKVFDNFGQGPGEVRKVTYINFDSKGNCILSDFANYKLVYYDINLEKLLNEYKYQLGIRFYYYTGGFAYNSKDELIIYHSAPDSLLIVLDKSGKKIRTIGKPLPLDITHWLFHYNELKIAVDEDDNIYCVFFGNPIIRKYDRNGSLKNEINYMYVDSSITVFINDRVNYIQNEYEKRKNDNRTFLKYNFIKSFSMDKNYIYIVFNDVEADVKKFNTIYVFNKDDYRLKKIIYINENFHIHAIDASADYIYAYSARNLLKIIK